MKRKGIAALACLTAFGLLGGVAQSQDVAPEAVSPAGEIESPDAGTTDGGFTITSGTCDTGNACIFSDTNYNDNKIAYGNNDCSSWCGPIVAGFPFGIGSAINSFTNRNFKVRVGTGGAVKCIPGLAPNLFNDGVGQYTYVRVGPNPSGCP